MSTGTAIEWTGATWNPITGCTRVSAGCDKCYSARMTHRLEGMGQEKYSGLTVVNPAGARHFNGVVKCHDDELQRPLRWRKPRRIFVNSMSDTFHKNVPFEFIDKIFAVAALCPQHTFQILTKRPERAVEYFARTGKSIGFLEKPARQMGYTLRFEFEGQNIGLCPWPLRNVWIGTSCEDQKTADERIPHLLKCPAAIRFLSCEPLLSAIDLTSIADDVHNSINALTGIRLVADVVREGESVDLVIVGGESGPGARPMDPDWARSIRDQCRDFGIAFFMKQMDKKQPIPDDLFIRQFPQ